MFGFLIFVVLVVLLAALVHRSVRRWVRGSATSFWRDIVPGGLVPIAAIFALLAAYLVSEWVRRNGARWNGVCPGGAPDIPAHVCSAGEYLLESISPFTMAGLTAVAVVGTMVWSAAWSVFVYNESMGEVTAPSRVRRALVRGLGVGSVASASFLVCQLGTMRALARWSHGIRSAVVEEEPISSSDYIEAWGLHMSSDDVRSSSVTPGNGDVRRVHWALREGAAQTVLLHWPKHCWRRLDSLPDWLFDRYAFPAPLGRAPRLSGAAHLASATLAAVGIRLRDPRTAGEGSWATSLDEARARLQAGEVAWEWFAVEVDPSEGTNSVDFEHRGPLDALRTVQPICQSSGTHDDR